MIENLCSYYGGKFSFRVFQLQGVNNSLPRIDPKMRRIALLSIKLLETLTRGPDNKQTNETIHSFILMNETSHN